MVKTKPIPSESKDAAPQDRRHEGDRGSAGSAKSRDRAAQATRSALSPNKRVARGFRPEGLNAKPIAIGAPPALQIFGPLDLGPGL